MVIKTLVVGMEIIGITFILAELHRYQVYKGEIEQDALNERKEVKHGQV
jgi:hypothetical protein